MKSSLTLGRPFGIPVGLHWSMLVLGVLATFSLSSSFSSALPGYPDGTYLMTALLVVVLFVASLLGHELAHAVVARRNGLQVKRIVLWVLGGLAELESQPATARVELKVAIAGPLASFGIAGVFAGLAFLAAFVTDADVLVTGLFWLAVINGLLGAFNLLPARPLDGGRVLTAVLWWRSGDQTKATLTASRVAVVAAWGMIVVGLIELVAGRFGGIWLAVIGWLVLTVARFEGRLARTRQALAGLPAVAVMGPPPPAVPDWLDLATFARDHAAARPGALFVVRSFGGQAVGVIDPGALGRTMFARSDLRVAEVARPIATVATLRPSDDVAEALGRFVLPPVLVVDHGQVVGQVTELDLARAAAARQLHRMGAVPTGRPLPPPGYPLAPPGPPTAWAPPHPGDRRG